MSERSERTNGHGFGAGCGACGASAGQLSADADTGQLSADVREAL